jgi:hypothetical protein
MTESATPRARIAQIRKISWVREDLADAALQNAVWYFDASTKGQKAAFQRAIAPVHGDYSPRANRIRDAARAAWDASTALAAKLYDQTFDEIMRTGEVSSETVARWSALPAFESAEVA